MEKTFQYHQQIFAGLELEIYNDLLKKDKIFLQCIYHFVAMSLRSHSTELELLKSLWG